ncbi:MAG: hypothetical protein BWK75_06855, partial [Candidatus Altiarchaeales archaeon A3]
KTSNSMPNNSIPIRELVMDKVNEYEKAKAYSLKDPNDVDFDIVKELNIEHIKEFIKNIDDLEKNKDYQRLLTASKEELIDVLKLRCIEDLVKLIDKEKRFIEEEKEYLEEEKFIIENGLDADDVMTEEELKKLEVKEVSTKNWDDEIYCSIENSFKRLIEKGAKILEREKEYEEKDKDEINEFKKKLGKNYFKILYVDEIYNEKGIIMRSLIIRFIFSSGMLSTHINPHLNYTRYPKQTFNDKFGFENYKIGLGIVNIYRNSR